MERNRIFDYHSWNQKLSLLLPKLFKRGSKRTFTVEAIKTSRGLAFLFVAILLAWISVEATQNQATESYRRTHWPKASVWKQTLEAQGLMPQKNLGLFTKLLKTHPAAFAKESRIWVSSDACVVYLSDSPFQNGPELWTCEKDPIVPAWNSLGSGLAGFEKMTDLFEITPKKSKAAPRKDAYKIDPKEFHY